MYAYVSKLLSGMANLLTDKFIYTFIRVYMSKLLFGLESVLANICTHTYTYV